MNKLVLCGVLSALVSTSAFSEEFVGSRVGVGYSQTDIEASFEGLSTPSIDFGSGFKLEYGYDLNQIVGLNVSYEQNADTLDIEGDKVDLDGSTSKLSTDLGYAFPIESAFLKPYVKLGYQFYSEDTGFDDNSYFYGLGLRFHYSNFYADVSLDKFEQTQFTVDIEYTQTAFTIGYKF